VKYMLKQERDEERKKLGGKKKREMARRTDKTNRGRRRGKGARIGGELFWKHEAILQKKTGKKK